MSDSHMFHPGEFIPAPKGTSAMALAFYLRAGDWADVGNLDSAITDYNRAIVINPMFAAALADRGVAWARRGDFDRAIADYNAALRLNPNDEKTRKNLAMALGRKYESEVGDTAPDGESSN
mgnify:FL=1